MDVKTIKQKVIIPASPEEVYHAYLDPKKHGEFTGSTATGDPVVGGKMTAWDGYISGRYLELKDGERIVQDWITTDWVEGYPASRLELTFREVPEGTEITLVNSNVPKAQADEIADGWVDFYWNPLKKYFSSQAKTLKSHKKVEP